MRQNTTHAFTWADQDWSGLMMFKNFCGSGLDPIEIFWITTGLALKNFSVHSSLLATMHMVF